jgi:hypothetical protein
VLIARGLTAWARLLTGSLAPTGPTRPDGRHSSRRPTPSGDHVPAPVPAASGPDRLPPDAATQLIHALAGLAVALTGT